MWNACSTGSVAELRVSPLAQRARAEPSIVTGGSTAVVFPVVDRSPAVLRCFVVLHLLECADKGWVGTRSRSEASLAWRERLCDRPNTTRQRMIRTNM